MDNVKEERKKDAENGHIHQLIERKSIVDSTDEKPYVFISYSSKDWYTVLHEIVYELCMKKGLRVYFDTEFDVGADSWLTQFQDNMGDKNCRAVLAFVSPNYATSYATLMELMSACEDIASARKPVLPIAIGNVDCSDNYDNTGLGTRRFPDYSTNDLWDRELELFNELFNSIMSKNNVIRNKKRANAIYSIRETDIPYESKLVKDKLFQNESYWKDKHIAQDDNEAKNKHWNELPDNVKNKKGKILLTKKGNAELVEMILSGIDKNKINGENKGIADAVYDKLNNMGCGDVFDKDLVESDEFVIYNVTILNGEKKDIIQVKKGECVPKQNAGVRDGFEFKGWFVSKTDEEWVFSNPVHRDMEIYAKWNASGADTGTKRTKPVVPISEKTTLKEFQGCFENLDFVYSLREVRNKCKKQLFDYLMASLLRGCDKNPGTDKAVIDRDRYNYCTYVISQTLNQEQPQIGASYYTWTSNARKALKREAMPSNYFAEDGRVKSGLLGDDINKIFEALDGNMTIGEVLQKYKSEEKGFVTKDNKSVLDAWELIKGMGSGNKGGKQGLGELLI